MLIAAATHLGIFLASCVAVSLKPEVFEGLRLDYAKMLNQSFGLTHR
jgi:hypothetical protein